MRYHNITTQDMLQGEGLRTALWLSGCEMHCKGCHNPETWDPNGGIEFDKDAEEELFADLDVPEIAGLTLTGGHPFHERNVFGCKDLVTKFRHRYGTSKTLWVYTGYIWEELMERYNDPEVSEVERARISILRAADVLVDGPFVQELLDGTLEWKGSSNQRVIDVQRSFDQKRVVLLHEPY